MSKLRWRNAKINRKGINRQDAKRAKKRKNGLGIAKPLHGTLIVEVAGL